MRPVNTAIPHRPPRSPVATATTRFLAVALLFLPVPAATQSSPADAGLPTIADYTRGMEAQPGYFPLYWDDAGGRLLLEVGRWDEQFLYLTSLATGVGSTRWGSTGAISRAHTSRTSSGSGRKCCSFSTTQASAPRPIRPKPSCGPSTSRSPPRRSEASPRSPRRTDARWSTATSFFLRDVVGIAARLQAADQGSYRLDANRSAIFLPRTKAFPENTEVEASLTFESESPGGQIQRHTPDGRAMTLRQHHSLVMLPDDGYTPRRFDPRIGVFATNYFDFGKPFDDDYQTALARRHRLVKADPSAEMSEPVEPVIYYLDPAVPEPYRTAFKIGGVWWSQVFEAAGFIDAFRIEDMPADMDPMDARYHVIQWVHRTEAGSSIGPSFVDPRTGEIIKAAVRMDSYRSLANYNTFAGAAGVDGDWYAGAPPGRRRRGVRDDAPPSALGARNRAHAGARPQLHRG